ncbi:MAG: glycosyltransferase family 4 protein [Ignavibacteriales bacterium]|nr:glycosyltransferase family 4 protein [Ignavibacteriales bacterium]MCF8315093.1 glycosyltransferase family 4 protein [Ignavibacteriales bacterium]MCF8435911.1 glycosyltransferase family 4 protein [Ignavibacteriales bacterium]
MKNKKLIYVDQLVHYISLDIVNAFAEEFDEVILLTGFIRQHERPLKENVKVVKLKKYERNSFRSRIWCWSVFTVQVWLRLLFLYKGAAVFFTTKPPLTQFYGLITRRRFAVQVLDVYPDILKLYNIGENNLVYRIWAFLNKVVFRRAIEVSTISIRMKNLVDEYTEGRGADIIRLWSGFGNVGRVERKNNEWAKKLGIQDKFVIQYAGNIGHAHNVEVMLEIAEKLKNDNEILFQIIGWGERFSVIENKIRQKNYPNVMMLPMQPIDVVNQSLSAANLSVILLEEKVADVSLPSKIYNLQNLGIPLLCFAPPSSELNTHLNEFKNGVRFLESEIDEIAGFILDCKNDPLSLEVFSQNSLLAAASFSHNNAKKFVEPFLQ